MNCLIFDLFICDSWFNLLSFNKYFSHHSFIIWISFIISCIRKFLFHSQLLLFTPFIKSFTVFLKSCSLKVIILFVLNDRSIRINVLRSSWSVSIYLGVFKHIFRDLNYWVLIDLFINELLCENSLKCHRVLILNNI